MTRGKSVKAETAVYTCRDYSNPNTVHVFINLQRYVILGFHIFKKKKKKATYVSIIRSDDCDFVPQFCIVLHI